MTIQRKYCWHPSRPDQRDHVYSAPHEAIQALPPHVDLRSGMPPVYDQGTLGSCTANAIAAAVEYDRIKEKCAGLTTPSRLFIYYNERLLEGTVNSDSGATLRDGVKTVVTKGVCHETEWPYDEDKFTVEPTPQCYTDALSEVATSYSSVPQNLTQIKTVLASGYPMVLGITVYASFESDEVAQTGVVPMPAQNEECLGGHALLAVGFDDPTQRFIIRNSWGTSWGQAGYFTLPYAYLTDSSLSSDFWVIKTIKS